MLRTIQRYRRPDSFADFSNINRAEYYVAAGRSRESSTLEESNFRSMLRALGGESETVIILRDSHWAVGWVETIYIHESDTARLQIADDLLTKLEDYPVISEDDWSDLEYTRACEYWERATISDRVYWCQRYRVSIFAARRNELPEDPSGELMTALAE